MTGLRVGLNIRHDLNRLQVAEQIEKQIAHWHALAIREKEIDAELLKAGTKVKDTSFWFEGMAKKEASYYSLVRVIELGSKHRQPFGISGFVLVYGDEDDSKVTNGTGPFESLAKAKNWFFQGGR